MIVYFSSFYSEACFFLTQICVLYPLQKSLTQNLKITRMALGLSFLAIILGCCVRSNGFLSIGYPLYYTLLSAKIKTHKKSGITMSDKNKKSGSNNTLKKKSKSIFWLYIRAVKIVVLFLPLIALVFAPFFLYNLWGFHKICSPQVPYHAIKSQYCQKYVEGTSYIF